MMDNTIELSKGPTGWNARFVGNEKIVALFGTDTIPTAFTAAAKFADVETAIQKLNPNHEIRRA